MNFSTMIAKELTVAPKQVTAVITLLGDGNTVPFIARYRKEATGSLDEVQIKAIEDRHHYLVQLEDRKKEVIASIDEQGKMTSELQTQITRATILKQVEDLYRPYKQKRRTKATIAKELGLEPLADQLLALPNEASEKLAQSFVSEDVDVETALQGARDILAERLSDDAKIRDIIRRFTWKA